MHILCILRGVEAHQAPFVAGCIPDCLPHTKMHLGDMGCENSLAC